MKSAFVVMAMWSMAWCNSGYCYNLTISGDISNFTDPEAKEYVFTEADLMRLPVRTIRTSTAWTPVSLFEGVSVLDILKKVGGKGKYITAYTLDDYYGDIPISDFEKYGAILAYKMNGKYLSIENFGPFFIVYPRDTGGGELSGPLYSTRFIWQIYKIIVK
ncbi:molybdopterin-dependent oxidoreductase [Burkholderia sp. BE17]|uniref:molybdopterin-dependent oxidoreductase n=1 Tax=Burkholderia sp. BE17 TaxID=2656644 RepID=UPI00128E217A|nr:molybdopterin-dependent oxidoreductase [Burkholderia sp. BE17]MPV65171.1 molybdopterin-dependent oxidoreductase [Burkholderia sp. BE17]